MDDTLRRAAVLWTFDPAKLDEPTRHLLEEQVSDPSEPRWSLRADVRRRVLRQAESLEQLRAARSAAAALLGELEPQDETQQAVLDRLLIKGPPFSLQDVSESDLALWIPAVRWFEGIVPDLPGGREVADALEERRLRGRLTRAIGTHFVGRKTERDRLAAWLSGPERVMAVSGPGGIGKSALVASFVSEASPPALFAWLDFDSAEIAPDDAPTLLGELRRQIAIQLPALREHLPPPVSRAAPETPAPLDQSQPSTPQVDWKNEVKALGDALRAAGFNAPSSRLLLVLDSFEAAQHGGKHSELWPFLEILAAEVPGLRVLFSGRAPVRDLRLAGSLVQPLVLSALDPDNARQWLIDEGIVTEPVIETVLALTRAVPLNLRLAADLVKGGDPLTDLSKTLSDELVRGNLYQRVLDRVVSKRVRHVARAALVLRRLSEDMLFPVLGEATGISEGEVSGIFTLLAKEMALVEVDASRVLRHRPDVRSAVLGLLETEDRARVRSIEARAVSWYADKASKDTKLLPELVYHRLRLEDLPGAEAAWRPWMSAADWTFAEEEMAPEARAWLTPRIGGSAPVGSSLDLWEADAARRIREMIGRRLWRAIPEITAERSERGPESPIVFLEAYACWKQGDAPGALRVLTAAGSAEGASERNRTLLRAALAEDAGDSAEAERRLATQAGPSPWAGRAAADLEMLGVAAARIRLAVDPEAEASFLTELDGACPAASVLLGEGDVVAPDLQARLISEVWLESTGPSEAIVDLSGKDPVSATAMYDAAVAHLGAAGAVEHRAVLRAVQTLFEPAPAARFEADAALAAFWSALADGGGAARVKRVSETCPESTIEVALRLAWRATLRRRIATQAALVPRLYELMRAPGASADPELAHQILAQVAAVLHPSVHVIGAEGAFDALSLRCLALNGLAPHPTRGWLPGHAMLARLFGEEATAHREPADPIDLRRLTELAEKMGRSRRLTALWWALSPSPLPRLLQRLVDVPD